MGAVFLLWWPWGGGVLILVDPQRVGHHPPDRYYSDSCLCT
jgi:hypothetical protein